MAENLETSLPPEVISSNQLGRAPSTDTISGTSCISSSEENDVQVKHGNLLSQVDEALNSEVSISDSNLSPSNNNANSFVLESCATAAKVNQLDGNQLRLKLLQKYKIRAKRVQKVSSFYMSVWCLCIYNKLCGLLYAGQKEGDCDATSG